MIRRMPSPILKPMAAFTRSSASFALFLAGDFGNQSVWNPLGRLGRSFCPDDGLQRGQGIPPPPQRHACGPAKGWSE